MNYSKHQQNQDFSSSAKLIRVLCNNTVCVYGLSSCLFFSIPPAGLTWSFSKVLCFQKRFTANERAFGFQTPSKTKYPCLKLTCPKTIFLKVTFSQTHHHDFGRNYISTIFTQRLKKLRRGGLWRSFTERSCKRAYEHLLGRFAGRYSNASWGNHFFRVSGNRIFKGYFGLRVKLPSAQCPPVYYTRWGLHTVPFYCWLFLWSLVWSNRESNQSQPL